MYDIDTASINIRKILGEPIQILERSTGVTYPTMFTACLPSIWQGSVNGGIDAACEGQSVGNSEGRKEVKETPGGGTENYTT